MKVAAQKGINYKIQFIGVKQNENESQLLQEVSGSQASFSVSEDFLFVRAKVISDKLKNNPFKEGDFEMAWTQPVP